MDHNGQSVLSPVRSVKVALANEHLISPNPTKAFAFIGEKGHLKIASLELIDNIGRVENVPFSFVEGGVNVDCRSVSHGTYFLRSVNVMGESSSSVLVVE